MQLASIRKQAAIDATAYLHTIENKLNGKFDAATFRKIVKSHSLYLHIVNDSFTALHGRFTNTIEQERSINYFICSSVFDDFWDDHLLTKEQIEQITFYPENYTPITFAEKSFLQAHLFLLDGMSYKNEYLQVLRKVHEAQKVSMQQFDRAITLGAIQQITFEKGGNSVLLCRYYLDIEPTKEEEQCWYLLGTMIQLTNDLFDTYKDLQQNSQTLATRCTDAHALENIFLQQVNALKKCIALLPYKRSRKQYFSIAMAATYTLGLLAIEQLKGIQGSDVAMPDLKYLTRKTLIIDMEKFSNIWSWIKIFYQYGKL